MMKSNLIGVVLEKRIPRKRSVFGGLASPARYGIAYDLKDKEAMPGSRLRRLYELRSHRTDRDEKTTRSGWFFGVPGAIRTRGLSLRSSHFCDDQQTQTIPAKIQKTQ